MRDPALRRYLERLAAAAGVSVLPLLTSLSYLPAAGATEAVTTEICSSELVDRDACLAPEDALSLLYEVNLTSCVVVAVLGEGTRQGTDCCYVAQVDCACQPSGENCDSSTKLYPLTGSGCMGRPYLQNGEVVHAPVLDRDQPWPDRAPLVSALDPAQRARLTAFWLGVAQAEHASIAEFHRICLELLRHGAPDSLVRKAQVAALDETRHAQRCLAVASAFAGKPLTLGPLPLGAHVEIAQDLPSLITRTVRDGCLAETCSAWLYRGLLARAVDPAARAVLAGVVRDETRHAELAWATLTWALSIGGAEARIAAEEAFSGPPPSSGGEDADDDPALGAFGWAPATVQDQLIHAAWRQTVLPLAAGLGVAGGTAEPTARA